MNQRVALRQLQKLGFSADTVANGVEALRALEKIPYQVVLMDCQMPELDGYEAARRIRQQEKSREFSPGEKPLHIIAMTANALTGDKEKCLEAGMNDYISKPVRIHELENVLLRGLKAVGCPEEDSTAPCTAGQEELPTLDENVVQSLRELRDEENGDPLGEFIELFFSDTPDRIALIKSASSEKDWSRLEHAAHTLKGSAGNLGAIKMAEICSTLVQKARAGQDSSADIAKLQAEFKKLSPLLQKEKLIN